MKRMWQIMLAAALVAVVADSGFAQGRGRGGGRGPMGQGCPLGLNQPNPNAGGWWTRVTPANAEQKAFVDEVTRLHNAIRTEQVALATLQAEKADTKSIAAKTTAIETLRAQLHTLMLNNRSTMQQLMQTKAYGWCGNRGWGCRANCVMPDGPPACGVYPACPYTK